MWDVKMQGLKELFNKSKLPEKPDKEFFKNYILNFYE